MRYLLLMALATVLVCGGCGDDSDNDPGECSKGWYDGDFTITTPSDVTTLAGYTSINGELRIECPSCTDLSELICLTSVGGYLTISGNDALTNLEGLNAITDLRGGYSGEMYGRLYIHGNAALINLNGLSGISILHFLEIYENPILTSLDGLSGITSMKSSLENCGVRIYENASLPDCAVCDLLDQFTSLPPFIVAHDNLVDTCTPVPAGCPGYDAGVDSGGEIKT